MQRTCLISGAPFSVLNFLPTCSCYLYFISSKRYDQASNLKAKQKTLSFATTDSKCVQRATNYWWRDSTLSWSCKLNAQTGNINLCLPVCCLHSAWFESFNRFGLKFFATILFPWVISLERSKIIIKVRIWF